MRSVIWAALSAAWRRRSWLQGALGQLAHSAVTVVGGRPGSALREVWLAVRLRYELGGSATRLLVDVDGDVVELSGWAPTEAIAHRAIGSIDQAWGDGAARLDVRVPRAAPGSA